MKNKICYLFNVPDLLLLLVVAAEEAALELTALTGTE